MTYPLQPIIYIPFFHFLRGCLICVWGVYILSFFYLQIFICRLHENRIVYGISLLFLVRFTNFIEFFRRRKIVIVFPGPNFVILSFLPYSPLHFRVLDSK